MINGKQLRFGWIRKEKKKGKKNRYTYDGQSGREGGGQASMVRWG